MNAIADDFKDVADFLLIYITDAHPVDEWHMDSEINFKQPKTQEERKEVLLRLID